MAAQPSDLYKQPGYGHPMRSDRQTERIKERQDLANKYEVLFQLLEMSGDVLCMVHYTRGVVYHTWFDEAQGYRQLFITMNKDQQNNWKAVLTDCLKKRGNKQLIPVWVGDECFLIHKGKLETDFYEVERPRKESCGKSTDPCD